MAKTPSHETQRRRQPLIVARTVVSKAGAVMLVTRLDLSDEGTTLLRSSSKGIGRKPREAEDRAKSDDPSCLAAS